MKGGRVLNRKSRQVLLVAFFFLMCSGAVYGQKFDRQSLEVTVHKAIEKAYSASVRMWGFDVGRQMQTSGQFSGVVVSADGYILTAAHVNTPNQTYKVMFPDGTTCIARGLGEIELADNRSVPDVAMMKIVGGGKWPYAEMGWSSALKKDEPCISIAYPETLNQSLPTVRLGYIADLKNKWGFIQSTCIMEPGDSGGPLFDYLGRVIGLHSAIDISESDNFEVPVDLYRKYWTALNTAETYKTYPPVEDAIGKDPQAAGLLVIPGLEKLEPNFANVASKFKGSSVQIQSTVGGVAQSIQGTLFSEEGLSLNDSLKNRRILISKSSLVGENPTVEMDGKQNVLTVITRDKENDLVLLATTANLKGGIKLAQFCPEPLPFSHLGRFLISPQANQTSIISIIGSREFSLPKVTSAAYLGAEIGFKQGWVVFNSIKPNSPASEGKLEPGDQVLSINGAPVDRPEDFSGPFKKYWPGDKITIKVMRPDGSGTKDITVLKEVTLGTMPQMHYNHPAELFAGGKSIRRDGFAKAFAHDAKLHPEQCGGPVFDADGRFYGINIARFSRTSSVVIPAAVILEFIEPYKL